MDATEQVWGEAIRRLIAEDTAETPAEKARRIGVPLIPSPPTSVPRSPLDTIAVCGKCGLELKGIMGYCCPQSGCPTGLGSTSTL